LAVRTTEVAVKGILVRNYDSNRGTELYPFLEAAAMIVDQVVECAATRDPAITFTAAELEVIERWLSAHFYQAGPDLGYSNSSTLQASGGFQGRTDMGLNATFYGQMAIRLDKSGCLAEIEKESEDPPAAGSVGAFWLGLPPSQQTDYVDRD